MTTEGTPKAGLNATAGIAAAVFVALAVLTAVRCGTCHPRAEPNRPETPWRPRR